MRRFAVIGGQSYSHIINPRSAESAKELALIERLKDTAAIVMTSREPEKMIQTPGIERFVEKE